MRNERAAWVLTGGQSRRMGTDKAFLATASGPLATRVARLAAQVCDTVSLVGDPGKYGVLGLRVIPDNFPGMGPLSGIEAALHATEAEWNLVLACDMPSLDAETLEFLFRDMAGFDCSVPRHADGKLEPLCAVYNRRCHPLIRAALTRGTRRVTEALAPFRVRYVETVREEVFTNWNTPQDLTDHPHG